MNEKYRRYLKMRLVPYPRDLEILDGALVDLSSVPWRFCGDTRGAVQEIVRHAFSAWWRISSASIAWSEEKTALPADGYSIAASSDGVFVAYADENGLRNALRTLRQIAEPKRGLVVTGYIIPEMMARDWPAMAFRGIHACVFPETERIELEKMLRLAAYYKMNTLVLEPFGTFPFKKHPEFCWRETPYTQEDFRYLVELGKSLGVAVCPALNVVGHAPWATGGKSGKFAVLDQHPEFASLYEPDGWCWCFSNPETRRMLTDFIGEMCDVFDNPPYFHIGSDEADSMASCAVCAQSDCYTLYCNHIRYFHDLLQGRGVRTMMWHDMLVDRMDPRWKGFTAFGYAADGTPDAWRELPKDIVICDWEYDRPVPEDRDFPISQFLSGKGFEMLLCPCSDRPVTARMGKSVMRNGFKGMLGTTWLQGYGRTLLAIFYQTAHAAWNPDHDAFDSVNYSEVFNTHLREVDLDAGIADYAHFGRISQCQQDRAKMFKPE